MKLLLEGSQATRQFSQPHRLLVGCTEHGWLTAVEDHVPKCEGMPHQELLFVGTLPEFLEWVVDHTDEVLNER